MSFPELNARIAASDIKAGSIARWEKIMGSTRMVAIVLVALGALALLYQGFTYTTKDTAAKAGPLELKVEKEHSVNIPVWAGVAALLVGGVLLVGAGRRS